MDELASMNQSARENALARFRIIQPCLEQDNLVSELFALLLLASAKGCWRLLTI